MNEEIEIKLKDVFLYPFYHLKKILCTALVFLLLGNVLLFAVKTIRTEEEGTSSGISEKMQSYLNQKKELETYRNFLRSDIRDKQHYLDNSILMSLDPLHMWQADYNVYISTNYQILPSMTFQNPDKTPLILNAYVRLLSDENLTNRIAEELDLEAWQLRELVSVSYDGGDTLKISVFSDSHDKAKNILQLFVKELPGIEKSLHKSFGAFSSEVLLDTCYESINSSISDRKNDIITTLLENRRDLETTLEQLKSLHAPSENKTLKYSILFTFLGLFLSYCFYCVKMIACNKLYTSLNLDRFKGLPHLGSVLSEKKISKYGRKLRKLEDRALSSGEDAYALVAANLCNYAGDKKNLLITGDASEEACKTVAEKLGAQLPGMTLSYKGSLLKDAASVSALKDCDGVVLVEQCMVSRYDHIEKELTRIQGANASLVGCVVVEL